MNVLFLIAHPDDEAYGPFGTIKYLRNQGHSVTVFCLCNGARPGFENVSNHRHKTFIKNCEDLGVRWRIQDNPDLSLEYNDTVKNVEGIIAVYQPEAVYTHNISDINMDHRILAEATLVACRPKPQSFVNQLYFFEVPSSTDWTFSQVQPAFEPNTYVNITAYIEDKKTALSNYKTETYQYPDARSIEAMEVLAKHRGYQVGVKYAEALKLVFSRV